MARLTDPDLLARYRAALGLRQFTGYLTQTERVQEWVNEHLGVTMRRFYDYVHDHVAAGGKIDQVAETRPEYTEHDAHYDLRFSVSGRAIYVETRLIEEGPDLDDTTIHIVSVHDA